MSQSIAEAISEGTRLLKEGGVPEPRLEAGSLLASVLDRDRTFLITHSEDTLSQEQLRIYLQCIDRRAEGEPLQYITGIQDFFGLSFTVTPNVLIPRPETELLVEIILDLIGSKGRRSLICDVGTGTGCIPIALLHELPEVRAIAIDLSAAAVQIAASNANRHSVSERISLLLSDSLSAIASSPRFDVVVSNPPYVPDHEWEHLQREVREHEPRLALTSGSDGLNMIRRLLVEASLVLVRGGYFVFEIGYSQRPAVEETIDRTIWEVVDIKPDLQGIPRIVVLRKR
jgi:release factor glutamine methyltransferase